jgi:hypothetical protein
MAQHDPDAKVGSYSDGMFYIDDQSVSHTSWHRFLQRKCLRKKMILMPHLTRRSTRTSILLICLSPIRRLGSSQTRVQWLKEQASTLSHSNHWTLETIEILMVSTLLVLHIRSCTDILRGSASIGYTYCSEEVHNTSFLDLLADNGNNFDFAFDNFNFINNSHQQVSNLLVRFPPLFNLLPHIWQAKSGKVGKFNIFTYL